MYKGLYGGGGERMCKITLRTRYRGGGSGGESEYVNLLYVLAEHNAEYRIQKVVYIKLPIYLFFE